MASFLSLDNLSAGYGTCPILNDITLSVEPGQWWALIGRNGSGKSTLIKTIAALLSPLTGTVVVQGKSIPALSACERARRIAYVPQNLDAVIPYTVYDFVMLGRYASMGLFGAATGRDRRAVGRALELCDVGHLRERSMMTLSGGECRRVLLAGALAQQTPLLLLDEPTTFLDPVHEMLFFRALHRAQENRELTVMMVTHDINRALVSCTHIASLMDGTFHYQGDADTFRRQCPTILETVFGIPFQHYHSAIDDQQVYGTWEKA